MKVAIITDYMLQLGGAEKVVSAISEIYPDADIFTFMYDQKVKERYFKGRNIIEHPAFKNTKWKRKYYRWLFPLYPTYVEDFDLKGYDLIISSSYLWAKGVLPPAEATHISYIHTPLRQAWSKYHEYLYHENDVGKVKRFFLRYIMNYIRMWDVAASNRVDHFVANSTTVKRRIEKIYRRDARVIHPPVDVTDYESQIRSNFGNHYVTVGRLVPYKRVDVLVRAFNQRMDKELYIIGDGNDRKRLEELITSPNIHMLGYADRATKMDILSSAKGFVFSAEEDFGISPVEAMASGIPVIGFSKGGSRDYIQEGINGIFFDDQTPEALLDALDRFEQMHFDKKEIVESVQRFSRARFKYQFEEFVSSKIADGQSVQKNESIH